MNKKGAAAKKTVAKKPGPGRPPIANKKKPFQLMLDPRYIEHFRKKADEMKTTPQELARKAMVAFVPDPFSSMVTDPVLLLKLLKANQK